MRLQSRDLLLLAHLADDFFLLARDQIQALIPRSKRRTNQRLALLVDAGYLSRRDPRDRWSPDIVFYYLGDRAAELLNRDRAPLTEQRRRAASLADSHLRHLYDLTWIHIGFLRAPDQDYHLTRWVDPDRAGWAGAPSLPIRPDGYLEYEKAGRHYAAFLELERAPGTENRAYLLEKMENYLHYQRSGAFQMQFGRDYFRVLFVTESESRAKALLKLFPADSFWVATLDAFRTNGLFNAYWRSSKGNCSLDVVPERDAFPSPADALLPEPPQPPYATDGLPPRPGRTFLTSEFSQHLAPKKQLGNWYWLFVPTAGLVGLFIGALIYLVYRLGQEARDLASDLQANPEILAVLIIAAIFALTRVLP